MIKDEQVFTVQLTLRELMITVFSLRSVGKNLFSVAETKAEHVATDRYLRLSERLDRLVPFPELE